MAITDRLGATVDATEAPSSSTPNAGIAIKTPVRAATTGSPITLSGLQTIDGVSLAAGDRVLVKDQTDQTTNGIYNVGTGQWAASSDFKNNTQITGSCIVRVAPGGTVNGAQLFELTTTGTISLGTSLITWAPVLLASTLAVETQRSTGGATTIVLLPSDSALNCNPVGNATCALLTASSRKGAKLKFKNQSAFTITLTPSGGDTIDTLSSLVIPATSTLTIVPYNDGVNSGWGIE